MSKDSILVLALIVGSIEKKKKKLLFKLNISSKDNHILRLNSL